MTGKPLPVWVVWGTDPDDPDVRRPAEAELTRMNADGVLIAGLTNVLNDRVPPPGAQISLLVTIGREPSVEDPNPPGSTASLVITVPDKPRIVWEFEVERRMAALPPLRAEEPEVR